MPNLWANSWVSRVLSCEMPTTSMPFPPSWRYSRSRNGKVYWQVGHETLKNAPSTGPLARRLSSEYVSPSMLVSSKGGATLPTATVDIASPLVARTLGRPHAGRVLGLRHHCSKSQL